MFPSSSTTAPSPDMNGDVRIAGQIGERKPQSGLLPPNGVTQGSANHPKMQYQDQEQIVTHSVGTNIVSGRHNQDSHFDPAYVITHSGPVGSPLQQNAAAAFFARKHKSQSAYLPGKHRVSDNTEQDAKKKGECMSNFATILAKCPPPPPPALLRKIGETKDVSGIGKVRVILRVANSGVIDEKKASFFKMDKKKKQVTLQDPDTRSPEELNPSRTVLKCPKMFAFDGLFTDEDSQCDVATSALCDILHGVVSGTDGALFCFGHANLGKSYTMIGSDESSRTVGIIPSAIAWLFRCIKEKKEKSGARFSVRVSAVEIGGVREELRDLLSGHATDTDPAPGVYLRDLPLSGLQLQNQSELRASTPEKAGYYLDSAISNRSVDPQGRDSHFVFTIHLYQYSVAGNQSQPKNSLLLGGRSRLHLIDFGSCERTKTTGGSITLSGLGNVILGIFNGQRHLPFRESKVTQLLKECLGSVSCQAAMLAHISPEPSHYSETLHTIQLASRIHRMRRKKLKAGGSSGGGSGSGSSDDNKRLVRLQRGGNLPHDSGKSSSDMTTSTDPSSSEQSCDTVIYVGPRDDEGTDAESPPVYLPSLNCGDHRAVMSKVLKGSSAEVPPAKYRSLERKQQRSPKMQNVLFAKHSPKHSVSSQQSTPIRAISSKSNNVLPNSLFSAGTGSLPRNPKGKMPLFGKVAGYRQPPSHTETDSAQRQEQPRVSISASGKSSRSRMSEPLPRPLNREIWVDSVPAQDKDLVLPQQYDSQIIYGYMDEHKKQMIQQWVEGQVMAPVGAPPSHLTGVDSLAWLQAQAQQQNAHYRILTQFKIAESSISSCSDGPEDGNAGSEQLNHDPCNPVLREMETMIAEIASHKDNQMEEAKPSLDENKSPKVSNLREESMFENKIAPTPDGGEERKGNETTCQHHSQNKNSPLVNEARTVSNNRAGIIMKRPGHHGTGQDPEIGSVLSQASSSGSKSSSQKSDAGTNTEPPCIPFNARLQDPFGAPRKLTLHRNSDPMSGNDELGNIRTLDELYTHCEQLVETLSQASEELKAQCQNDQLDELKAQCQNDELDIYLGEREEYIRIHQSDCNGIDDIEIFEVMEGSEGCVEVVDSACQASEEDIALCLGLDPSILGFHQPGLEQHPLRILSQENLSSAPSRCQVTPQKERIETRSTSFKNDEHTVRRENHASAFIDAAQFEKVCEEVSVTDHEVFFNKKFDQLAKLHELYQSVSSISAKSQSHLEAAKNKNNICFGNQNRLAAQRSTSFSLTGLLTDLDNLSLPSNTSDDLKSLCSEPAGGSHQFAFLDINKNSTTSLDILDMCHVNNDKCSMSLTDLATLNNDMEDHRMMKFSSELNVDPVAIEERCDSPILEGIDSELAKYAKLKDLEQAYKPKQGTQSCQLNSLLSTLRHPDGASNPDLKTLPTTNSESAGLSSQSHYNLEGKSKFPLPIGSSATLPRRSPGNGRSSSGSASGSDQEENPQKQENDSSDQRKASEKEKEGLNVKSENHQRMCWVRRDDNIVTAKLPLENRKEEGTDKASLNYKEAAKKDEKQKVPKFSRLFGSVKRISKSPTQISKMNEEKERSKTSKRQTKSFLISSRDSSPLKIEKFLCDKSNKDKHKHLEKKDKQLSKSPLRMSPKNVKGTLSSEFSCEKPAKSKSTKAAVPSSTKTTEKDKRSSKPNKESCKMDTKPSISAQAIPSPYSFPSPAKATKPKNSETSGSGYDSGNDSGIVANIKTSSFVKIRGKGAEAIPYGSRGLSLHRRSSRSHCKSSGYESIGLDSERSSVDSYQGTIGPKQSLQTSFCDPDNQLLSQPRLAPMPIIDYDESFVKRLDRRWRFSEVKRLKRRQEDLKSELFNAKSRINAGEPRESRISPGRWSYELHTEASELEHTDPNFLEAFAQETVILGKRVEACQSHVELSTCFDAQGPGVGPCYRTARGCGADCEPEWVSSGQLT